MKIILTIILFAFTISLNAQNYKEHKVKTGETIESIAKQYLVTPFDIYALNPDAKAKLQSNTVLIIPNSRVKNNPVGEETRELIGYKKHKVKRKETLFSLSQKYSVSIEELKKANRSLYSKNLKKGDKIQIPRYRTIISKKTLNNTVKKYTVLPAEGKWRIAYKFGITLNELEDLNPEMSAIIQPGDLLNVPNIAIAEEKAVETTSNYYEVLPKEGFYRLEVKLGLTQVQLETLNPELKDTGLKAGMVLKIPAEVDLEEGLSAAKNVDLKRNLTNFKTKKLALLMPYRLHRIDTDSIEETKDMIKNEMLLSIVLNFHVGVVMALDSAKQLGISTHLKVLDTRNQPSTTSQLLETNDFSDYDAVIGPMNAECIDRVALALRSDRVPLMVPMSKPKEVYTNVFQTIPEAKLLHKAMIDYIKSDTLKSNIVVIADQGHRAKSEIIKREFPRARVIFSRNDKDIKTVKDGYFIHPVDLENVFATGKTIVFLETNNNEFASSVISMLNGLITETAEIVLVTLDKNKAFDDNVSNTHLSNLKFHYPSVNKSLDEDSPNSFVNSYKKIYGVLPNKYAVRGFDVTLDLLLRLASEDDLFEAMDTASETEYIENKFRYHKTPFGGYLNQAVYVVKYDDLKIVQAN